jgi:hypothetical protein
MQPLLELQLELELLQQQASLLQEPEQLLQKQQFD